MTSSIFGALSENEWSLIIERIRSGIARGQDALAEVWSSARPWRRGACKGDQAARGVSRRPRASALPHHKQGHCLQYLPDE